MVANDKVFVMIQNNFKFRKLPRSYFGLYHRQSFGTINDMSARHLKKIIIIN